MADVASSRLGVGAEDRVAAHVPLVRGWNPLRQRRRQRVENRVEHGRQRQAPAADRRGTLGAEQFPGRKNDFQGAERTFVDFPMRRGQRFKGDPGDSHTAGRSAIDEARHLIGDCGKVDDQLVAPDFDFDLDRDGLVHDPAVVVEKRRRFVNAVRYRAHGFAHKLVGLLPDRFDGFEKNFAAVLAADLIESLLAGAAASDLRAQITERRFRKADIVLN